MELRKHQLEAVDFLATRKKAGLFFDMGLGKTLCVLSSIKKQDFPVLIIAPLSVVPVWPAEMAKFGFNFTCKTLTGTKLQRLKTLQEPSDFYVINYEGLRLISKQLLQKGFKTIIADESHRAKNRSSQQTTVFLDLAERADRVFILSGTPVTKSPEDIWTQMHAIAPGHLGNFYAFRARYIDFRSQKVRAPGGYREIKIPHRFKNLAELEQKVAQYCLRRTKDECLDLPEKIYKKVYCELSKEQLSHYINLKTSLATQLSSGQMTVKSAATMVQKLGQVCQGFLYTDTGVDYFESGKIKALKDLMEDIPAKDNMIIFTWHVADVDRLKQELKDSGREVLLFEGSSSEREAIVNKFQSTEGAIFLSNVEKAKEGITLTKANHVVYFGNTYNYATRAQSEDRAHRIGQVRHVVYYDLVCPHTVDEAITDILLTKKNTADKILGDSVRLARMAAGLETI